MQTGLVEVSGGSWSNSGNLAVGYSGGGTLRISGAGAVSSADVLLAASLVSSGTVNLNGGTLTTGQVNKGAGNGIFTFDGGTLRLSGNQANLFGGFDAGNVTLAAGGGTLDTQDFNVAIPYALSGSGGLTKTGSGNLTLSGASTFSGATTISAGTLTLANALALQNSTLSSTGGSLSFGTLTAATLEGLSGSNNFALTNVSSAAVALTVGNNNTTSPYSGILSGSGSLTKLGAGTLTLSGANTYGGGTTLWDGTLSVGHNSALGSGALTLNGGTLIANGGARTLDNPVILNADTTLGGTQSLTLSGLVTLARNRDITVSNTAITTISGSIGESGGVRGLFKQGGGELELTGANTYTGGTTVAAGTVRINNATGSAFGTGAVTVASGATLTGAGSFTGALQLNGTFSPGNSPGTTNTGSQTWAGGAGYIWEINNATGTAGINWDILNITGTLNIAATGGNPFGINLTSLTLGDVAGLVANFDTNQNHTFLIAAASDGISGFSADKFNLDTSGFANDIAGGSWNIAQSGNSLNLVYTSASAIPEPSTYALLAGFVALGLAAWRRRRL